MPGMSAYDRWLTTPPEDRWQAPEDEVEINEPTNPFWREPDLVPDAGGYGVYAVMDDGDVLCRACTVDPTNPVHDERQTFGSNQWTSPDGWGVIAFGHTGELEEPEHCAHCNKEIG